MAFGAGSARGIIRCAFVKSISPRRALEWTKVWVNGLKYPLGQAGHGCQADTLTVVGCPCRASSGNVRGGVTPVATVAYAWGAMPSVSQANAFGSKTCWACMGRRVKCCSST